MLNIIYWRSMCVSLPGHDLAQACATLAPLVRRERKKCYLILTDLSRHKAIRVRGMRCANALLVSGQQS